MLRSGILLVTNQSLGPIPDAAQALGIDPHGCRVWVRAFGRIRVFVDYQEVPLERWPYPKVLTLLRYLLLHRGYLSVEQVAEHLWPQLTLERARQNFAVALHHLRKILEPDLDKPHRSRLILYRNQQVRLDHALVLSDYQLFQQLWQKVQAADPAEVGASLSRLLGLYAGPLYEDNPYFDLWCQERERMRQTYLLALETMARLELLRGNAIACVNQALQGLQVDPLNEPLHLLLMEAYRAMGHRTKALERYHQLRRLLDEELGVSPSRDAQQLYETMLVE